jgi:hypothetical protein
MGRRVTIAQQNYEAACLVLYGFGLGVFTCLFLFMASRSAGKHSTNSP